MSRNSVPRVYCLLIIVSIARNWVANGQGGDCPPLLAEDLGHTGSFSEAGLISMALAVNATQPEVQLFNYTVVCIAQGTMKNTWRMVSGVALYNIMNGDLEPVTKQFHFQCDSDGSGWTTTVLNSTEFTLTAPNATTFNTDNRTDCALCVSPELMPEAENEHHCVACATECNGTGLMRCTSQASSDCCTHFDSEGRCINGSCPGNSVPSATFDCICPPGYSGAECTEDINECEMSTNPCANGANCTNTGGNFTCDCPTGFTGKLCDINVNECESEPCVNGGTCMDNNGSFTCDCPSGFTGSLCDMNVTGGCTVSTCMNGGSCVNVGEGILCLCSSGYTGAACEVTADVCNTSNPCMNGAECISDGVNGTTCNCTVGWSGTLCDVCTLDGCVNCTSQNSGAVCIRCEDSYRLENESCQLDCKVEGCVRCLLSSGSVCEMCEGELLLADNGSSCTATTVAPSTATETRATPSTVAGISTDQLIGVVVGSVIGGLLLILLAAVLVGAVLYCRKKSRVTLTFDLNTIKATHVTANPVFEDIAREDSGIENDDEIMVNRGALEFEDY